MEVVLDEASLQGENHVVILKDNEIVETVLNLKYGFSIVNNEEIRGGDSKENAKITVGVLSGEKCLPRYRFIKCRSSSFRKWKNGND